MSARAAGRLPARAGRSDRGLRLSSGPSTAISATAACTCATSSTSARPKGSRAFRSFVEQAADLVVRYGGSLSGEHGDGQARGELLERMFGPGAGRGLPRVQGDLGSRRADEPGQGRRRPARWTRTCAGPGYRRSGDRPVGFGFGEDGLAGSGGGSGAWAWASAVATRRARCAPPSRPRARSATPPAAGRGCSWRCSRARRLPASWRSEEVREALDLCIACKGCESECPVRVDIASYKAEFMAHHYAGRLRPRSMYAFGLLPWVTRLVARTTWLPNVALGSPVLGTTVRRAAGVTTARPVPRLAPTPFRRSSTAAAHRDTHDATVVVWPDTFTDAFRPFIAEDLVAVLEAAGERVAVPSRWGCCGRTLYDPGLLGLARRTLANLLDVLDPWSRARRAYRCPRSRAVCRRSAVNFRRSCGATRGQRAWRLSRAARPSTYSPRPVSPCFCSSGRSAMSGGLDALWCTRTAKAAR